MSADRKRRGVALVAAAAVVSFIAIWPVVRAPAELELSPLVIHDVTQLNPIMVGPAISPTAHPRPQPLEPVRRCLRPQAVDDGQRPVDRFDDFVRPMRDAFQRHDVNVINVSIRHAKQDPGSLLAWARTDVFAFVIYYKQGTSRSAQEEVGIWTRTLIDAALDVGGSYYLPYQLHATEAQFLRAYPGAHEFFALKQRLDPTNRFRNALWDKYYHP